MVAGRLAGDAAQVESKPGKFIELVEDDPRSVPVEVKVFLTFGGISTARAVWLGGERVMGATATACRHLLAHACLISDAPLKGSANTILPGSPPQQSTGPACHNSLAKSWRPCLRYSSPALGT